jgi:hypothetical protein
MIPNIYNIDRKADKKDDIITYNFFDWIFIAVYQFKKYGTNKIIVYAPTSHNRSVCVPGLRPSRVPVG